MDISKFLAKAIGIYFIIICTAFFINMEKFLNLIQTLVNDAPLMFVTGFFTVILGILMVVGHNVWRFNWRVIITIIGWLILLKGASILLYPPYIQTITKIFIENAYFAFISLGTNFIVGLILLYYGFIHKQLFWKKMLPSKFQ